MPPKKNENAVIIDQLASEFFTPSPYFYAHLLRLPSINAWTLLFNQYLLYGSMANPNGLADLTQALTEFLGMIDDKKQLNQSIALLSATYWLQRSPGCSPLPELIRILTKLPPLSPTSREELQQSLMKYHQDVYTNYVTEEMTPDVVKSWVPAVIYLMQLVQSWNRSDESSLLEKCKFMGSLLEQYNRRGKICDWGTHLLYLVRKKIVKAKNVLSYFIHCIWMSLVWTYPFDTCMKVMGTELIVESEMGIKHLQEMQAERFNFKVDRNEGEGLDYARCFIDELKKY